MSGFPLELVELFGQSLGGRGVVIVGYLARRKKLYTVSQFVEHLARDVIPKIIDAQLRRT